MDGYDWASGVYEYEQKTEKIKKECQAVSAIKWECENCNKKQYSDDTLETKDINCIREDRIICMYCGFDNFVFIQDI